MEEFFVGSAEVVQALLAVWSLGEAVFRALAMAGESHIALAAKFRQCRGFGLAEFFLFGRIHHASDRLVHDISQLEFGINKMIAGE